MVPTRPGRMIKEMFTSRSVIVQALFTVLLLGNKLTGGSPVCHPECIGGCHGPSNTECVGACKTYSLGGVCVESCPDSHYISNRTDDGITIGDDIGDEYWSVNDKEVSHTAAKPMIDEIPSESSPVPKTVASGRQNESIEENFIQPQGSLHGRVNEQSTPNNMADTSNFTSDDAEDNKTLANNRSETEIVTSNSYTLSSELMRRSGNYEQHRSSSAAPVTVRAPDDYGASPTPTNLDKPLQATRVCLPCHAACRGGCSGPLSTDCVECKVKTDNGTCVSECPAGSYKDHGSRDAVCHRCHDECRGGCHGDGPSNCTSCKHFKERINGQVYRCVFRCSGGSLEEPLRKNFESLCISEWGDDEQHINVMKLVGVGIAAIIILIIGVIFFCIYIFRSAILRKIRGFLQCVRTNTIILENSIDSIDFLPFAPKVEGEESNIQIVSTKFHNSSFSAIGNNTEQRIPAQLNTNSMNGGARCLQPSDQDSKGKSESMPSPNIGTPVKLNSTPSINFPNLKKFLLRRVGTSGDGSVSVRSEGSECDSGIGSLPNSEQDSSLIVERADEHPGDSGCVPRMPCKHNDETSVSETTLTTSMPSLNGGACIFDNGQTKQHFKPTTFRGQINSMSSKAVVMKSRTRAQKVERLALLQAGETTTDPEDNPMKQKEDKVSTVHESIKGLLDKFNQVKASSHLSSSQQFSTKTFVVGVIGAGGGNLKLAEMGVNLYIPAGALDEDQTVYFYVEDSNYGNIKLNKGETVVTPTIYCGPPGRKFNKEVILSMPHCLEGDASIDWSFVTYRTQSDGDPSAEWERVPPEQTLNIVKNGRLSIFIDHFTGHKGVATSSTDASDQAIKKIIIVLLFAKSLKEGDIDFPFRVKMCSDLPSDIQSIVNDEGDIGNKMFDKQPLIICDNKDGITLSVDEIEQGWTLKGKPEKVIHHDYFWGTASGIPSHTFVLDRIPDHPQGEAKRRRLVRCMLHVYQSSCPAREVQILVRSVLEVIPDQNMVEQGHGIPRQPPENSSSSPCRPKNLRPVNAAAAYKPESSRRQTPSEKFCARQKELNQTETVLHYLPDEIARQLCTLLDVQANGLPAPDWCTLAEALELDHRVIDYLTQRQRCGESPTSKLLDFFFSEKCASETSPKLEDSLPELISIFRRIGHDRARMLIEAI
ncbi:uncharacterized protein [Ptychodera flava]|uniref:uncharacterized protein n=1 Tax=Ptychodera flava TaxID=63121 RepID=UPI003969D783